MLTRLNRPLRWRTPKGDGLAHFVIACGPESNLMWVVFMDAGSNRSLPPQQGMKERHNLNSYSNMLREVVGRAAICRKAAPFVARRFPTRYKGGI
jgi:hypothetical protein